MEGGGTSSNKRKMDERPAQIPKIELAIKSQDGDEMYYRYVCDKNIRYLFMKYCKEKNIEYKAATFLFNGKRITTSRTPIELGLEDGDIIDVMMYQSGGGYSGNMQPRRI